MNRLISYACFSARNLRESFIVWCDFRKEMPMKTGDGDSSGIPSNVPAFLVKLWKLVEDPQYEEHISWNKVENLSFTTIASRQILWLIYHRSLPDTLATSK